MSALTQYIAAFLSVFGSTATIAVDNGTFSNIGRYTQFAGAAYSEDCPSIPFGATVLQTWNQSDTDIKAILFQDSKANEVILSFRGSATPKNLDQDLLFTLVNVNLTGVTAASCSGCQVHTGFQSALQPIQAGILSAIKATNAGGFFGPKLTVTGHSLGAGLASLAAGSLVGSGLSVNAVYTFGEPRNGNPAWSKYMNGKFSTNYFRVTHYNDGVPQIPPQILGYQHHGTEYWESLENANTASTTLACLGQEPAGCNAATDFGESPINKAHLLYTNQLIASVLYNPACGYVFPS